MSDKKDQIIDVALELFSEKGFEGASIRSIAEKASVNIAMVNYYFGSKEKLFEAIVEKKAGYMKGLLESLANDTSLSETDKMDAIIVAYVNRLLSENKFHRVLHQELLMRQRENLHSHIIAIFTLNSKHFRTIIEQGIKKKEFKKVDPELTMASILGTINQVLLSESLCNSLINKEEGFNPYTDNDFRKRLISHIKQMVHDHLLINNNNKR